MPGRGRPFEEGNKANPRGRPRGVKETMPRGFVKKLAFAVVEGNEQAVRDALKRAATSPKTVLSVLALAAKLNKEIGTADSAASAPTIINFRTNVNMLALRAAAHRAAPAALHSSLTNTTVSLLHSTRTGSPRRKMRACDGAVTSTRSGTPTLMSIS
jgi:hypothetical protein